MVAKSKDLLKACFENVNIDMYFQPVSQWKTEGKSVDPDQIAKCTKPADLDLQCFQKG